MNLTKNLIVTLKHILKNIMIRYKKRTY